MYLKKFSAVLLATALLSACTQEVYSPVSKDKNGDSIEIPTDNKNIEKDYLFGLDLEKDLSKLEYSEKTKVVDLLKVIETREVPKIESSMLKELPELSKEAREIVFYKYIELLRLLTEIELDNPINFSFYKDLELQSEFYDIIMEDIRAFKENEIESLNLSKEAVSLYKQIENNSLSIEAKVGFVFLEIDIDKVLKKFEGLTTPQMEAYLKFLKTEIKTVHIDREGTVYYDTINERATSSIEAAEMSNYYEKEYAENASFYLSWLSGYFTILVTSEPYSFEMIKSDLKKFVETDSLAAKELYDFIYILSENNYELTPESLKELERVLLKYASKETAEIIVDDFNNIKFD